MYILLISRGIPTPDDPQFGCFEKDQAEALAAIGHKVVVISVDSRFRLKKRKFGITLARENNVDYYNSFLIPGIISRFFGRRFSRFIKEYQINRLYKRVKNEHGSPDLIYAHFFFNILLGKYIKEKYNIPLIGVEHAARFVSEQLDKESYQTAKEAYAYADKVITVSPYLSSALNQLFNVSSIIVPNLYNSIYNIQEYPRKVCDTFTFVSIGTLEHRKGFDILIKAFKEFHNTYIDSRLIIIGDGEEVNTLKCLIANNNLSISVELVGRKSKNEIAEILSSSQVFVLASRSETFGVVYIEAMAMGLPVIGTQCGGPNDIIHSGNGYLVPVDDITSLSRAMINIYQNYSVYNSIDIAKYCEDNYSSKAVARKLTEVFEDVIIAK